MIVFLDSSCILRSLLRDGQPLQSWGLWERAFASDLARVEVRRGLYRARSERRIGEAALILALDVLADIEDRLDWCPLSLPVVALASERETVVVGTLDALQLASARSIRDRGVPGLIFATHDHRLASSARSTGFEVEGV